MVGLYILILIQLIGLTIFIVRIYSTAYFTEKGKSLATKQDIGEITDKIEQVRIEYKSRLESTKVALQQDLLSNQHFFQKSTEILLRYYDTLIVLSYDNLSKNFGDITGPIYGKALLEYQEDTAKKFTSLKVDYHRLLIFMDGQEKLMQTAAKLLNQSFALANIFNHNFSKIKIALLVEHEKSKNSANDINEYKKAVDKTDKVVTKYRNDLKIVKSEFNDSIGEFIFALMEHFKQKNLLS